MHVEKNDRREEGLVHVATSFQATRLYIGSKKKLFGKSSQVPDYCSGHLPDTCTLIVVQGGRKIREAPGAAGPPPNLPSRSARHNPPLPQQQQAQRAEPLHPSPHSKAPASHYPPQQQTQQWVQPPPQAQRAELLHPSPQGHTPTPQYSPQQAQRSLSPLRILPGQQQGQQAQQAQGFLPRAGSGSGSDGTAAAYAYAGPAAAAAAAADAGKGVGAGTSSQVSSALSSPTQSPPLSPPSRSAYTSICDSSVAAAAAAVSPAGVVSPWGMVGGVNGLGGMSGMGGMSPMGAMGGMGPMGAMGGMGGMGPMGAMGGMGPMGGSMGGVAGAGGMNAMGGMGGLSGMGGMAGMGGVGGGMGGMGGIGGFPASSSLGGGPALTHLSSSPTDSHSTGTSSLPGFTTTPTTMATSAAATGGFANEGMLPGLGADSASGGMGGSFPMLDSATSASSTSAASSSTAASSAAAAAAAAGSGYGMPGMGHAGMGVPGMPPGFGFGGAPFDFTELLAELARLQEQARAAQLAAERADQQAREAREEARMALENARAESQRRLEAELEKELAKRQAEEEAKRAAAAKEEAAEAKKAAAEAAASAAATLVKAQEEYALERLKKQQEFREYSIEELEAACDGFSEENLVGEGGYGSVYKGMLEHFPVAVKVLKNAQTNQALKEFKKEVEVQRGLRHPTIVLLIGCCHNPPCLVYEYMPQGSLYDRLLCDRGSPPLPWNVRFEIFENMCKALIHLHNRVPAIVHLDLKPANVLLDNNFVAKLGDVGLARFLVGMDNGRSFMQQSMAVGTFGYVDPHFLRTGQFSRESDVYSLGMVMLDMLIGINESSGERGKRDRELEALEECEEGGDLEALGELLDPSAGCWPPRVARRLVQLVRQMAHYKRKARPDLSKQVMAVVEELRPYVDAAVALERADRMDDYRDFVPNEFRCPITMGIMENPVLAADGHTYEREAIEQWLRVHHTSPKTGRRLDSKALTDNIAVRSMIAEWLEHRLQRRESHNLESLMSGEQADGYHPGGYADSHDMPLHGAGGGPMQAGQQQFYEGGGAASGDYIGSDGAASGGFAGGGELYRETRNGRGTETTGRIGALQCATPPSLFAPAARIGSAAGEISKSVSRTAYWSISRASTTATAAAASKGSVNFGHQWTNVQPQPPYFGSVSAASSTLERFKIQIRPHNTATARVIEEEAEDHAHSSKPKAENEPPLDMRKIARDPEALSQYWGIKPKQYLREDGTPWPWHSFRPTDTYTANRKTELDRHFPVTSFGDAFAKYLVKSLRFPTDLFFQKRYGCRAMMLETVAAVPGMVAGVLLHMRCLRLVENSGGWIRALLEEAENERMHLMTFMQVSKPTWFERGLIFTVQSGFAAVYGLVYLLSPRIAHRIVGYLEEEAVHSYTQYLKEIDEGRIANVPAPQIAIDYWQLPKDATLYDVVLSVRADEAHHRDVNHYAATIIRAGKRLKEHPAPVDYH
ncbi:unnamed protein product [Closterium sp. Yama58-4]|nr:unnamed protein product [Closterium sp. Yama58-4]